MYNPVRFVDPDGRSVAECGCPDPPCYDYQGYNRGQIDVFFDNTIDYHTPTTVQRGNGRNSLLDALRHFDRKDGLDVYGVGDENRGRTGTSSGAIEAQQLWSLGMPGGAAAKGWAKIMSAGASTLSSLVDLWDYFFGSDVANIVEKTNLNKNSSGKPKYKRYFQVFEVNNVTHHPSGVESYSRYDTSVTPGGVQHFLHLSLKRGDSLRALTSPKEKRAAKKRIHRKRILNNY